MYNIETTIAKGKYGTVYLGINNITHQQAAIKIQVRENKAAIVSELEILKKLDHPNIIKCLETFQDSKFFYIISDYCSGGELIKPSSTFSEIDTKEVIYKLLSATSHMHSKNIIHRDLKPENILIDSSGELKIIDFGLSIIFTPNSKLSDIVGTPIYMAPEITNESYGPECDLWSIGIIMYYMMLGNLPNFGENKAQILKNLKSGKFEINLNKELIVFSHESKDLLARLLCRNPQKRISCKEALLHDWFSKGKRDTKVPKEVMEKVKSMGSLPKAQFLVLSVAVAGLGKEEINQAKNWFHGLENQKTGIIKVTNSGIDVHISYTEFLIFMLREKIVEKVVPKIYQWCVEDGVFSTEALRSILCRRGNYVSFSLFAGKFLSLEEFQSFLS